MANAEVGDEQRREDPTVGALDEEVARLCGKAAAVFVPSGTMCNIIACFIRYWLSGLHKACKRFPDVTLAQQRVETNIVQFRIDAGLLDAAELARRMEQRGIRIGVLAPDVLRVVTHLDVDGDDIDETLTSLRAELDAFGNRERLRAVQGSESS